MNKQDFLKKLQAELAGLPESDVAERLAFYSESIEDRMEDGLTEEEAVVGMGAAEEIAAQIRAELQQPPAGETERRGRRLQGWEILLLVLGFPLWFPLLLAAFAVLLSVYIVLWSLILCLWAAELALAVSALGAVAAGILSLFRGDSSNGLLAIGAGLALAGLSVFLFFGCKAASKGAVVLTGKIALRVKSLFLRKEK